MKREEILRIAYYLLFAFFISLAFINIWKIISLKETLKEINNKEKEVQVEKRKLEKVSFKDIAQIKDFLMGYISDQGLEIIEIGQPTFVDKSFYNEVYLNIKTMGNYESIINFLNGLKKEEKLIVVENFSIKSEEENILGFNVNFKTYILK